jgi:hypothetical protein
MYQYLYWCDRVVSLCLCTSIYTDVTVWYHCVYVPVFILVHKHNITTRSHQYKYWYINTMIQHVVILCLCTSTYTDVTVWYHCVLCTSIYTDVTMWYHCVYVPVLILMWPCGIIVFMYQYLYWCDRVVILCLCTSIYTDVTMWYHCVYVPVFILMWPCGNIVFMY